MTMKLEDVFDFEKYPTKFGEVERIRIKGHRISIEHVIKFFKEGQTPEQIRQEYSTLTLTEVYATIAYYLLNQEEVEAYMKHGEEIAEAYYQEHLKQEPAPVVKRLRELRAQQEKSGATSHE